MSQELPKSNVFKSLSKSLSNYKIINNKIDDEEHKIKICLLGNSNVGKSTIALRLKKDEKEIQNMSVTSPTVGAAFSSVRCNIKNMNVVFHIWDTAGQEKFHSMVPFYLRGTHIFIIIFDMTDIQSFNDVFQKWIPLVESHLEQRKESEIQSKIMIIGNKTDLYHNTTAITEHDDDAKQDLSYKYITDRITQKYPDKICFASISALTDTSESIIKKCFQDTFELYFNENNGKIFNIDYNSSNKDIIDLDIDPGTGCMASCILF